MNPEEIYITKVYLLNVPLESDYKNTLYFASKSAQQSYFQSKVIASYSYQDFSYQRKDQVIRIPTIYDNIAHCNYVMYQNTRQNNKWYYAFVDRLEYINDGRTDLHIQTDVLQTWLFDYNVKASFIEREHVDDDSVGLHTIPEDLNIGQIISDYVEDDRILGNESGMFWIVISCNYNPVNGARYSGMGSYAGYPQGSVWFGWLINMQADPSQFTSVGNWITSVVEAGHTEDINNIFVVPLQAFSTSDVDATTHMIRIGSGNKTSEDKTFLKSHIRLFRDYPNVKNNKLYTYPYSYLRVTNNAGSFNDYKIEDFHEYTPDDEPIETDELKFNLIGVPCEGYSGKIRPKNYQGVLYNEDESLSLGKLPTLSWSCDAYTNWITQQAINIPVSFIMGGASAIGNTLAGNIGGTVQSLAQTFQQTIGAEYQASKLPNTARGNANAGDIGFVQNITRFKYLHMRPKKEYLKIIDDYFSMFGYKCNQVKIPNSNHRERWWYTKTLNVNINGNVPQEDLQKIKDCYNNGITFWRNPSEVEDYSLSNEIV